jgi:hypothetical protein
VFCQLFTIVLKFGSAGQSRIQPTRSWNKIELKKKTGKEKTRLTQQDPVKNPVVTH